MLGAILFTAAPHLYPAQAQQVGLGAAAAEQIIEEIIEATEPVIGEVGNLLPDGFPLDTAKYLFSGMRRQLVGLVAVA